jgi:hypothetical protein
MVTYILNKPRLLFLCRQYAMNRATQPSIGIFQLFTIPFTYLKQASLKLLFQMAWSEALGGNKFTRLWPGKDIYLVGRLQMQRYHIDQFILSGSDSQTINFGFTHSPDSPLPGNTGNCVLNVKHDLGFNFLPYLKINDEFSVESAEGKKFSYRISDIYIADKQHMRVVFNTPKSKLTLVAAYPFTVSGTPTPLRYIIVANLII